MNKFKNITIIALILLLVGAFFYIQHNNNKNIPNTLPPIIKTQKEYIKTIDTITQTKIKKITELKHDTIQSVFKDSVVKVYENLSDSDKKIDTTVILMSNERGRKCIVDSVSLDACEKKSTIKDSIITELEQDGKNKEKEGIKTGLKTGLVIGSLTTSAIFTSLILFFH